MWMENKYSVACVLFLIALSPTYARQLWPYEKLVESSELVAVVEVSSVDKTNIVWEGHGDPKLFQSHIAHLEVVWVVKGDQKIKDLDLLFFTSADSQLTVAGLEMVPANHSLAPRAGSLVPARKVDHLSEQLLLVVPDSKPVQDGPLFIEFQNIEQYQYLVFLRKDANDRFVPATGHFDASISVKAIKSDHYSENRWLK